MSRWRPIALAAATLAGVALVSVLLLSGTERATRSSIAAARLQQELNALNLVLPAARYSNELAGDRIEVIAPDWLGSREPVSVWRARMGDKPSALVLQVVARDGYSGPIGLRIGVDFHGRVTGVRVTHHQETPGLGDAIEAERSDWILEFEGRALGEPPLPRWTVRRSGGDFDQFAGATVTPKAVVKAVRLALQYVDRYGSELYKAPTGSTLTHLDAP